HGATKPSCKVQDAFTEQRNLPARCRMLSRSNETFLQGAGRFHGCNETFLQGAGRFHGSNETFLQGTGKLG
ncbi:hypothetical protein V2632_16045, partial [Tenacibaculum maritimum]|uniref:hypothetical protein n=2 Tax=Tenacibaculum maritimum TaxID=107401 RepID=UPI00387759E3